MNRKKQTEHPENHDFTAAKDLIDKGDYEGARKLFETVLEYDPDNIQALCNSGLMAFHTGDTEKAEQIFLACIHKNPEQTEAYFNLGRIYQNKQQFEKALSYYKAVVLEDSGDSVALYSMGQCARALGRLDDAVSFMHEAIRLEPGNLEIGVSLAGLYVEQKEYENAEDVLRVILVSHADVAPVHFSLGLILKEQGKYESALAQFTKVVQLDDSLVQGFYQLAETCVELGFVDQAEPFYAKASKLDPDFSDPVLKLAELAIGKSDEKKAALMYEHWIDMRSSYIEYSDEQEKKEYSEICRWMADLLSRQGREEEALEYSAKMNAAVQEEVTQPDGFQVSLTIDD